VEVIAAIGLNNYLGRAINALLPLSSRA
jgi:hypothetical protein